MARIILLPSAFSVFCFMKSLIITSVISKVMQKFLERFSSVVKPRPDLSLCSITKDIGNPVDQTILEGSTVAGAKQEKTCVNKWCTFLPIA